MQYLLLVYTDDALLETLPPGEYDQLMRGCLSHADELKPARTARSLRVRNGQPAITDGPFAETKEVLAGFNLIEADNLDEAVRIAHEFPWSRFGCIEVRPVHDMGLERQRVGLG
jgi:hypothetical protein